MKLFVARAEAEARRSGIVLGINTGGSTGSLEKVRHLCFLITGNVPGGHKLHVIGDFLA